MSRYRIINAPRGRYHIQRWSWLQCSWKTLGDDLYGPDVYDSIADARKQISKWRDGEPKPKVVWREE